MLKLFKKDASEQSIMMGVHQPQTELFSYQVNLDRRIRADHPLRRIIEAGKTFSHRGQWQFVVWGWGIKPKKLPKTIPAP
jgi:hypothetical protein